MDRGEQEITQRDIVHSMYRRTLDDAAKIGLFRDGNHAGFEVENGLGEPERHQTSTAVIPLLPLAQP